MVLQYHKHKTFPKAHLNSLQHITITSVNCSVVYNCCCFDQTWLPLQFFFNNITLYSVTILKDILKHSHITFVCWPYHLTPWLCLTYVHSMKRLEKNISGLYSNFILRSSVLPALNYKTCFVKCKWLHSYSSFLPIMITFIHYTLCNSYEFNCIRTCSNNLDFFLHPLKTERVQPLFQNPTSAFHT